MVRLAFFGVRLVMAVEIGPGFAPQIKSALHRSLFQYRVRELRGELLADFLGQPLVLEFLLDGLLIFC